MRRSHPANCRSADTYAQDRRDPIAGFGHVKPVAAADIDRCGGGDLHRPLRTVQLGTPHSQIGPMARFGAIDREGNAIEIGFSRRTKQIDAGRRLRNRTAQHRHRPLPRVGERHQFAVRPVSAWQSPWSLRRTVGVAAHHSDGFAVRILEGNDLSGLGLFGRHHPGGLVFRRCPASDDLNRLPPRLGKGDDLHAHRLFLGDMLAGVMLARHDNRGAWILPKPSPHKRAAASAAAQSMHLGLPPPKNRSASTPRPTPPIRLQSNAD